MDGPVVLITGGTGSLGQAIVRFLLIIRNEHPMWKDLAIRVFSRDEQKQAMMKNTINDPAVRYLLGDVRDADRVRRAVDGCDMVIHAAALKIIPAGEYCPDEVIKTNIFGSQNVIEACIDAEVDRLICISSDKAVLPVNLYGYTKACMEKLAILANNSSGETKISVARYGNVIGSRGSIFTLLHALQTEVRLTHPEMTRFWITLPHAATFVVERLFEMNGGEIFIPKMKSASLKEVVEALCPLASITYGGMRPGEKLEEDIINPHEVVIDHGSYYTINPTLWLPPAVHIRSDSPTCLVSGAELVTLYADEFADALQS